MFVYNRGVFMYVRECPRITTQNKKQNYQKNALLLKNHVVARALCSTLFNCEYQTIVSGIFYPMATIS